VCLTECGREASTITSDLILPIIMWKTSGMVAEFYMNFSGRLKNQKLMRFRLLFRLIYNSF
jgi:hypothetical protein